MMRILRSYFFWTYERGSFHYDVMVTLILAFIFITPHVIFDSNQLVDASDELEGQIKGLRKDIQKDLQSH